MYLERDPWWTGAWVWGAKDTTGSPKLRNVEKMQDSRKVGVYEFKVVSPAEMDLDSSRTQVFLKCL